MRVSELQTNEGLRRRGKEAVAMCLGILGAPKCMRLSHTYLQSPNADVLNQFSQVREFRA